MAKAWNLEDYIEVNDDYTYHTITSANTQDYFSCRHEKSDYVILLHYIQSTTGFLFLPVLPEHYLAYAAMTLKIWSTIAVLYNCSLTGWWVLNLISQFWYFK